MTRLFNDPGAFVDEAIVGFVAAHRGSVARVSGGVIRDEERDSGVAVVTGGGSGHYPAFAGLVGPGLVHGAALGNVFASPSAQQICSVARAVERGSGVLFTFGNYTGDVLNFTAAKEQLESEGIECRIVPVTDDIASAPRAESHLRRGIAGGMMVYKMSGRAADEGRSLDEVAAVAELANERTRSIGVAFSGCTLPGSDEPLFGLPVGRMSVGMGVHGEPGIAEQEEPTARGLAELLVGRLLADVPDGVATSGARAAVMLNGLGTVKYEELFVVYGAIDELLRDASIEVVGPEVGEFTTSFDMAGVSLTVCWLTDDLGELWLAPAHSPAFKRGEVIRAAGSGSIVQNSPAGADVVHGSPDSHIAAEVILECLRAARDAIRANVDHLGALDAVAGDGDHGIGMQRGSEAAVAEAEAALGAGSGAGTLLDRAGQAWAAVGGGTSGVLWGVLLSGIGLTLGDERRPTSADVVEAIFYGTAEVQRVGKAAQGDKTLLDALIPFVDALQSGVAAGDSFAEAWRKAAIVATSSAESTADLMPKVGRARPLGEKSLGSSDPGAISLALVASAVAEVLNTPIAESPEEVRP